MIDYNLVYFSFVQGILTFFAPCAVALLPGYISFFLEKVSKEHTKKSLLLSAIGYGSLTLLGVLLVYLIAGTLVFSIKTIIQPIISYLSFALGGVLIVYGTLMLLGKNVSFTIHGPKTKGSPTKEAFTFGIFYAITALGCLFPLFLGVVTSAITAPNIIIGSSYFVAYFLGMALLLFVVYIAVVYASTFVQKSINKALPYITKISGVLLILGGIYILYYQGTFIFY